MSDDAITSENAIKTLTPAHCRLIDYLARQMVADYLREDLASNQDAEHPVLPDVQDKA